MSLYNLVHGENPMAVILLGLLGLKRDDVPRYRDCYWTGEHIAVHTRTGGGNREGYKVGNSFLQELPTYVRDQDDYFDSTYATFYFAIPDKFAWVIPQLQAEDATPAQRWQAFFDKMKEAIDENDPQMARVMSAMRPLLEQIQKFIETPERK